MCGYDSPHRLNNWPVYLRVLPLMHIYTHVDVIYLEPLIPKHHSLWYTADEMNKEGRELFCNSCCFSH